MKRQDGATEYPTSLTDEQWELIRHELPKPARLGRGRSICRRQVLNAVFYVLRTGCAWRMLPQDFPSWKTVYGLFLEWRNSGVWQRSTTDCEHAFADRPGSNRLPVREPSTAKP